MKDEGKIRAVGFVAHFEEEFLKAFQAYKDFDFIMIPFNPVNNKALFSRVFATALKQGMGIVGIKPFAAGSLFKMKNKVQLLQEIESHENMSLAQTILKYIIKTEGITSTIPAMNSIKELQENLGTLENMSMMGWEGRQLIRECQKYARKVGPKYLPPCYRWLHEEWTG